VVMTVMMAVMLMMMMPFTPDSVKGGSTSEIIRAPPFCVLAVCEAAADARGRVETEKSVPPSHVRRCRRSLSVTVTDPRFWEYTRVRMPR
jgi:hypothetical protein